MDPFIEQLRNDYERHGRRNLGFWVLAVYRFGRWSNGLGPPFRRLSSATYGALITGAELVLGSVLHRETTVGEGLHLIHGHGIRISGQAVIGKRVGIAHDVTIGTTPDRPGAPIIGDDVFIGAGAKLLGPIRVGDRARIAANSLVISDVPADTTAIGVPAKILRYTGRAAQDTPSSPEAAATPPDPPADGGVSPTINGKGA
jgi:serine O-acetyltransferase